MGFVPPSEIYFDTRQEFIVIDYGRQHFPGTLSPFLLQVVVDFVPQNVCNEKYSLKAINLVDSSMICAAKPSQSVCNGDGGGPLMITCERTREDP